MTCSEHGAEARAHRDPDVPQPLRVAGVLDLLAPHAADVRQRAVDGANDVGQADLPGGPGEPVAAVGAPPAADEPGVPEVGEDVLEEVGGICCACAIRSPLSGPSPAAASSTPALIA